jgi:glycosyltransferase involved in cell wall biosynthesis
MRILTLSYEFPPLGGGGAKVVYGLTKELVKRGHQVDLVTMGFRGLPKFENVNGMNVHRVSCIRTKESVCYTPELGTYIFNAISFTLKLARQNRYDLNHTHFIFPDGLIAYFLQKKLKLPFVITAHGSDVPGFNPDRFKLQHKLLRPLWRKIIQASSQIICPSESLQSLVLKEKSDAKTTVIPNGLDVDKFKPDLQKKRSILLVSRMLERKGIQYFLKAIENLNCDYEANVVGDGPYLKTLQSQALDKKLKVHFLGWYDNGSLELKKLYEASEIFIFPSEAENFPIVLLEAMAAGMAIITTKGTGCEEVVGDTGLLVESRNSEALRDAISKLVNDPNLRAELGRLARRRFEENFNWDVITKRYCDVYTSSCKF